MAALTASIAQTLKDTGGAYSRRMNIAASTHIYEGGLVGINATGEAIVPEGTAATVRIVGVAQKEYNNTEVSATTGKELWVMTSAVWKVTCNALPIIGATIYAATDNPDDCNTTAGTLTPLGTVLEIIDATAFTCYVKIEDAF